MPDDVAPTTQNVAEDSGGVDPTRPVGPGNPPRAHQFQKGNPGRQKGVRNSRTIILEMLDVARTVEGQSEEKKAQALARMNEMLGEDGSVTHFTQREFVLAGQVAKAMKQDTAASRLVLELAGELRGEDDLPPATTLPPVTFVVHTVKPKPYVDPVPPPTPTPAPAPATPETAPAAPSVSPVAQPH